ncbi:MAG: hypothetical protein AB7Y74_11750 [Syntrophorhabdus sp.]
MKNEWKTYLETIGIQGIFLKRVGEVINFYQEFYPDQIEDIFVTEYFDKEENRQYESVWLFSMQFAMEAKQFLVADDFDSTPLQRQVKYWTIKKTEFDFRDASIKSRMHLQFELLSGISGNLKASRENCNFLMNIFRKYILSNVIECSAVTHQMDEGDGI